MIFVVQRIYFVAPHNFHVALEDTLYHEYKTRRLCTGRIASLTTCEVLRQASTFLAAVRPVPYKPLIHEYLCSLKF